jgi:hypothetical protein
LSAARPRVRCFATRDTHVLRPDLLPDGQVSKNLSSPFGKNISISPSGKSALPARAIPSRKRALAIVTNVGMGCGGRGSVARVIAVASSPRKVD